MFFKYHRDYACFPTDTTAYVLKGQSLQEFGKDEDAIACFDKAMDLGRNDAGTYIMRGNSLFDLNKNKLVMECFNTALCLYPDSAIVHYELGKSLQSLACNEESLKCFRKTLQLGLDTFSVHLSLGTLFYTLKQYAEALLYEKSVRIGSSGWHMNILDCTDHENPCQRELQKSPESTWLGNVRKAYRRPR